MFHDGCAFNYKKIVMKCGYTDLRAGIPSLSSLLSMIYGVNWNDNDTLYFFCGRTCGKIKGLIHTVDGFVLVNILLETARVKWDRSTSDLREITPEQLDVLIRGGQIF